MTWSYSVRSCSIDVAKMFHIEGELRRDGFYYVCDPKPDSWAGCDIRVRYRYAASEKSVLSEQTVRDQFTGALRLKIEAIAIPDRDVRQPEVAAAITLPDKLAAYRKEPALPPSVANKVDALLQQTPEQLLAGVSATLASVEASERVTVAA